MILKKDHTLWAVGSNKYCQLGTGDTADKSTPVQVMNGTAAISAGDSHTMILMTDGSLWATGQNNYSQLDDRTTYDAPAPEHVLPIRYNGLTVSSGKGSGSYLPGAFPNVSPDDSSAIHRAFDHFGGPDSSLVQFNPYYVALSRIFMPNRAVLIKVIYHNMHALTIINIDTSWYDSGKVVTVTAYDTASKGKFTHWGGPDSSLLANFLYQTTTLKMPFRPVTIKPVYGDLHSLTVIDGSGSGNYYAGNVSISANDSTGTNRDFHHWAGPDSALVEWTSGRKTTIWMPDRAATIKAAYADLRSLTVTSGSGSGRYVQGALVTITANDSTSNQKVFDHWGGPDSTLVLHDTSNVELFVMPDRTASIAAVYRNKHALTVTKGGGSGVYDRRAIVSILANDSTAINRAFDHWGGPDSAIVLYDSFRTTTATMPAKDAAISSVYRDMYSFSMNGAVVGWYDRGTVFDIAANDSTASRRVFDHWGGPDSALVSNNTASTTKFSMPPRNAAVTVLYRDAFRITYDKNGGDVEACPQQYVGPISGRLPTPPFRKGYSFAGWNSKADGTGAIFSETSTVTADITVYAQWENVISSIATGARHSLFIGKSGTLWAIGDIFASTSVTSPFGKYSAPGLS
jgi:uncharacterized repeat protein (TIGR02543 family)